MEVVKVEKTKVEVLLDVAEAMWGVIANAGGGNWDLESDEWREAAERARDSYLEAARMFPEGHADRLSASEALYGFAGWLTTVPEQTIMSSTDDVRDIPEKIALFCKVNGLVEPREGWSDLLTHPQGDDNWMKIIKVRRYKVGYEVRDEQIIDEESGVPGSILMKSAYTVPDGLYIGSSKWAHRLIVQRGIKPEVRQRKQDYDANGGRGFPCSIGFCSKDRKWYGWSHRAIYGFGIGSEVKMGDCAFQPAGLEDFTEDCVNFWKDDCRETITSKPATEDGRRGLWLFWTYNDKVSNKDLLHLVNGVFCAFPETWGRGEWVAKTLDDARQMACDFAEGVS